MIYPNTFDMIERIIVEVGQAYGTRFEFECYDIGHLYKLEHFVDRGLVKPPLFRPDHLRHLGRHRRRSREPDVHQADGRPAVRRGLWLSAFGRQDQMAFLTMTALMGGNVRVGLEDSLYIGRGKLAKSNAEQVAKIRRIMEDLGWRSPRRTRPARSCS